MMNLIDNYSFHDSKIKEISVCGEELKVAFSLWNEKQIWLTFYCYRKINYTFSNEDINEFHISIKSPLLEEAIKEIIKMAVQRRKLIALAHIYLHAHGAGG